MMHHARMSIFNALLKLFAVLLFTCLGLLVWSKYWELPGVFYQNLPFPVEVEQVMSGETVPLNVERCNRTSKVLSYLTTHTLVNLDTGAAELLPDVTLSIDPGCHRVSQRLNLIPRETTSGRYMLKGVALIPGLFEIHPIPWYSEQFIVVASSPITTQGAMGPAGPKGDAGAKGAVGAKGASGETGATGATGKFWGGK